MSWRGWVAAAALLLLTGAANAAPPQRIVVLAPHLAELVCAAGGCAQLVAAVAYSDYPASVAALPQVGDAFSVDLERVLALQPDLVLAWAGISAPHSLERLRRLGIPVEELPGARLDDIPAALEQLGTWLDHPQGARAAAELRLQLDTLRQRYAGRVPVRVFYQIDANPPYTVSGATTIGDGIALCGGVNVFASLSTPSAAVSVEAIIAAAPDAVIHGQGDSAVVQAMWARLPQLPWVRAGRVVAIDTSRLARPSPRLVEGLAGMCAAIDALR